MYVILFCTATLGHRTAASVVNMLLDVKFYVEHKFALKGIYLNGKCKRKARLSLLLEAINSSDLLLTYNVFALRVCY